MKIQRSFVVSKPRDEVWLLFQDIPALADCMPGAMLDEVSADGVFKGQVSIKLGPFKAAFQGQARHVPDPQTFSGHAEGSGLDKKGGSRSRMALDYALVEEEGGTRVSVDADIQLSGPIAQFGRAGVIEQTAGLLIGQFANNVEQKLGGGSANAKDIKVLPLLRDAVVNRIKGDKQKS